MDLDAAFSLEALAHNFRAIQAWVIDHAAAATVLYLLIYAASSAAALPIGAFLSMAGGLFFGLWWGALLVTVGATAGAALLFLAARMALADLFRARFIKTAARLERGFKENGVSFLLMLRLMPIFPFFAVNAGLALTGVGLWLFVWTTLLGILPGVFVFVYFGVSIEPLIAAGQIPPLEDVLSPQMLLALALLGLMALLPSLWKKWRALRI